MKLVWMLGASFCAATSPIDAQVLEQTAPKSSDPAPAASEVAAPISASIGTLLSLQSGQIKGLDRLYDAHARRCARDISDIARLRNQLAAASLPASSERSDAPANLGLRAPRERVAADLLATRARAREVLSPLQRAQLDAYATDPRFRLRADRIHHLLLAPADQIERLPLAGDIKRSSPSRDSRSNRGQKRRSQRPRGVVSTGVYGGYSYGRPNYGVYGNYGRGAVGVGAGIGRGGPSFGVSVGRVFSRIR